MHRNTAHAANVQARHSFMSSQMGVVIHLVTLGVSV